MPIFLVDSLVRLGVRHVFGVGGANIEDVFASVQRRRPDIRAVLCKHEHGAGTAADAYSRLTGLGAVMVTSGGAAMNLVHSIAEARASAVPLVAIVGEPPTQVQGRGAFQDTSGKGNTVDARAVFRAVAKWCERVEDPDAVPRLMTEAVNAALGSHPGPAVLLLAKDRQLVEIENSKGPEIHRSHARPSPQAIRGAISALSQRPIVIIAGDEVPRAGARQELAELARVLDASVAVTPEARDAFDNEHARFLGVAGAMGHAPVTEALANARGCVLVGTRLPLLARMGIEPLLEHKPVLCIGGEPAFVESIALLGEIKTALRALLDEFDEVPASERLMERPPTPPAEGFSSETVLTAVLETLPDRSVVLVDAGNTGAQAVHHLRAPRGGRWLLAMGMAGMGWTYGAAIGAACATGRRCTVVSGDGAFFMHGLEVHTAVEHPLPITYVLLDNGAHGMCLVREHLLLEDVSGYNTFRRSHLGAGLGTMFPELCACDCRSLDELRRALGRAGTRSGPSLISVELEHVEIPPFAGFLRAAGPGVTHVERS